MGAVVLAVLRPPRETLPIIGGGTVCSAAEADKVLVSRYADLISRPEFAALARENKSITTNDFLAYFIVDMEVNGGFTNFRLLQNINSIVNVIDSLTSAIIVTAPAKHIVTTFQSEYGVRSDEETILLVLGNDGNTGYVLIPIVSTPTV